MKDLCGDKSEALAFPTVTGDLLVQNFCVLGFHKIQVQCVGSVIKLEIDQLSCNSS